jgi:selenoprotein W-related protein
MGSVGIDYCAPCGLPDHAVDVQRAVLERYGQQVDGVEPVTADRGISEVRVDGGVFEVRAGGEVVFDKATDDYHVDAIVEAVGDRAAATA